MEERERILKLLEEGKINAEEATKLLEALGEPFRFTQRGPGPDFGRHIARKIELSLKDLPEIITTSISGLGLVSGTGEEKQLEFNSKPELIIKSVSGDVKIQGDDEKTIRLKLSCGHKVNESEDELVIKTMAGDMDIKVPSTQKVVLKTASGDVKLENLAEVSVRCGSGDIEIEGISQRLAVALGSGDLDLSDVFGPLAISIGSGDLEGKNISGEVTVSVGSGDIDLDIADCKGGRIELGSGDLDLYLPEDADVEVTVILPKSGSVENDFEFTIPEDVEEFKFDIGTPRAKLYVKTKYGDITIHKKEE